MTRPAGDIARVVLGEVESTKDAKYKAGFAASLAIHDCVDGDCNDQLVASQGAGADGSAEKYGTLASVLADDRLRLNAAGTACTQYLGVELVSRRRVVLIATLALVACVKKAPPVVESDAGGAASSAQSTNAATNAPGKRPATTSWSIAGGNLDGEIESRLAMGLTNPKEAAGAVELLLARGQFTAKIADYERALDIAQRAVTDNPKSPEAHRAYASVLSTFHRWDEAEKELDAAAKVGADSTKIASTRGSIALARGQYDEASKTIKDDARDASDMAMAAVLAGLMQRHADAQRSFDKARETFRDVAPFPLAWMAFERARWLDAQGKAEQARAWYEEAVDAIPVYAHAAVHLAGSDPPDRAIARLEPLTKTSDDPDVLAALADAHARAKHEADAKKYGEQAKARYDELLKKHPATFADHAARFSLKNGDAKRALELAQANAKTRTTEEALDLLLGAATAANAKDAMCDAASKMKAFRWVSPERKRLAEATLTGCPTK